MKRLKLITFFSYLNESAINIDDEIVGSAEPIHVNLPKSIDWRHKGAVTEVKKQKKCGCCYAFATIGAVEGHHFLKTGHLLSLSEQNIVDCSVSYGNSGCDGGVFEYSFNYIRDHGICTEESYPYRGDEFECKSSVKKTNVTIKGYKRISSANENELQAALVTHGPISVAIDAVHDSLFHYKDGIWHEPNCSSESLNHGVLLVGYGTDEFERDYYILKNSWGKTWGNNGFFKMSRNHMNQCGIATNAVYPID